MKKNKGTPGIRELQRASRGIPFAGDSPSISPEKVREIRENVAGSFILGFASVVILERLRPEYQPLYLLVGTGFCGGFTTFSTFELETLKLVRDGSWWPALANVLASVLVGFLGVLLGVTLAGLLFPRQEG